MTHKTIIIMPFSLPWDWSADYQRKTCEELSKNQIVICSMHIDEVFFIKKIFTKKKLYPKINNIFFFQPFMVLPFNRFDWIKKCNHFIYSKFLQLKINKRYRNKQIISWVFDPCFYLYPNLYDKKSIYDCVDYHANINQNKITRMENILIKNATYFVVNSDSLYSLHKKKRIPDLIVPQGFSENELSLQNNLVETKNGHFKKTIIGYIGAISSRIDFFLLQKIIQSSSKCHFILWGPIQNQNLKNNDRIIFNTILKLPNVSYGKSKNRKKMSEIISQFDIGIIPYKDTRPDNKYSYPMKLFEYFYFGMPVISTSIIELEKKIFHKYVFIGKNDTEWQRHIKQLSKKPWSNNKKRKQRIMAQNNSWHNKIASINSLLYFDSKNEKF